MDKTITAKIKSSDRSSWTKPVWQYDYGQTLNIEVNDTLTQIPQTVEIQFSLKEKKGDTESRVGTTSNGITSVIIPNELLKNGGKQ